MLETDRRNFFKGSFGFVTLVSGLAVSNLSVAQADGTAEFLSVSQFLTGRTNLSNEFAKAALSLLMKDESDFDQRLKSLETAIKAQNGATVNNFEFKQLDPRLVEFAHKITNIWYTGVFVDANETKLLAFDTALMFDATRDCVVVPTYCTWRPNYWTEPAPTVPAP